MKRRIEQRSSREGADALNVKTGHGGIRDIEFVIQFLQLLNGGDLPSLRTGNTLEAIAALENCGCLTHQERTLLEDSYSFLRKIEHRLQIMFDLQTHTLPAEPGELRKVAIRLGCSDAPGQTALATFESDYKSKTELNRKILDHLLHDAFSDDTQTEPESDLVLDPEPPPERVAEVLARYHFGNVQQAYQHLMELATEKIRFLSTRRCRHFLAAIAPQLLQAIAATPDPDFTLINLSKVSDSLGGKGVLWELFSFHPPTLHLYVELCSSSEYLSGILISNPGMLDELMDGLLLDKLPSVEFLDATLAELTRAAEDIEPMLHSFKNAQQLRVGVLDILGKQRIEATSTALSDIAQVCLNRIARAEYDKLAAKLGEPTIEIVPDQPEAGTRRCELIILALGKFGGRELNYYSDLDLIFLFEADGTTVPFAAPSATPRPRTSIFSASSASGSSRWPRSWGPTAGSIRSIRVCAPPARAARWPSRSPSSAATSPPAKGSSGNARRCAKPGCCWPRPKWASALAAVTEAAYGAPWQEGDSRTVREMRMRVETGAAQGNLKRGPGGLVDIEFLVQMLQLKHGHDNPNVRPPGTHEALVALGRAGYLGAEDTAFFVESYRFLRTLQSRLRLLSITARDNLPEEPRELAKLAGLLHYATPQKLLADCQHFTAENRRRFERLFDQVTS